MSDDYEPDSWVKMGDSLNFLGGDVDWMNSKSMTDVVSVKFALLPILLFTCGVLVFLGLVVLKFCSSFCCEISCRPKIAPSEDLDVIHRRIENQISTLSKSYYFLCFGIIVAAQIIVTQRMNLLNGTAGMQTFVDDLNGMFSDLSLAATNLATTSAKVAGTIGGATACINSLDSSNLKSSSDLFVDQIDPTRDVFTSLGKYLDQGLGNNTYLECFAWGTYGLLFLFALILGYMNYQRNTCGVKFFTFLGGFTYFVTLTLGIVFLCVTMVLANTCMNPYDELLESAPASVANNLEYYFTCEGENVLFQESESARASIASLQASVASIKARSGGCSSNSDVLTLESQLGKSSTYIGDAQSAVPCEDVKEALAAFIENSLCTQLYRFNGGLWVCFQLSSLFILLLIVIGNINSQYYRSEGRRKIAANVMDLDGIIPDNASDEYPLHHDLRASGGEKSWATEEASIKKGKKKMRPQQESKEEEFVL